MKIIVEVVATNMDTGHIAVSQQVVEVNIENNVVQKLFLGQLRESKYFEPKKVGPILIARSFVSIV